MTLRQLRLPGERRCVCMVLENGCSRQELRRQTIRRQISTLVSYASRESGCLSNHEPPNYVDWWFILYNTYHCFTNITLKYCSIIGLTRCHTIVRFARDQDRTCTGQSERSNRFDSYRWGVPLPQDVKLSTVPRESNSGIPRIVADHSLSAKFK